ncbi:MAG: pseudouridine-5-phosphate glycosidase [Chloroflexi bacterium RBG_16_58_14]|nr:MAG: pseudouridine-5-phosphate glycosidase [Chloroflexi bacterium RBG_16_58_14]
MEQELPSAFVISAEVSRALERKLPVVALESTVITHGLPYPENLSLAEDLENSLRRQGVTPATIGVIEGRVHVGLAAQELQLLATGGEKLLKISQRDFATAITRLASGGTTVAGTMFAAHRVGIRVFATGGIGGVHYELSRIPRGASDLSADLPALARIPMIVVCAGAKAILDLQATLEYLETWSVPVVGYRSDSFPAFYARSSGIKLSLRLDTPEEVVMLARTHWELGLSSAILVAVPPPEEVAMDSEVVKNAVRQALTDASREKITGQAVSPYLLEKVRQHTGGESLRANMGLLLNNAELAGQIARVMQSEHG